MSYWGYHLILDCSNCDPLLMQQHETVYEWVRTLVKDIDMQPIGEPHIEYTAADSIDKAGFTVVQLIVTSSIVAHFVDNLGHIYLDVFSCKKFDPEIVKKSVKHSFGCSTYREHFLARQA
jgi:S-adenosylmethionine/arginine decarboxylase-like enzyme